VNYSWTHPYFPHPADFVLRLSIFSTHPTWQAFIFLQKKSFYLSNIRVKSLEVVAPAWWVWPITKKNPRLPEGRHRSWKSRKSRKSQGISNGLEKSGEMTKSPISQGKINEKFPPFFFLCYVLFDLLFFFWKILFPLASLASLSFQLVASSVLPSVLLSEC